MSFRNFSSSYEINFFAERIKPRMLVKHKINYVKFQFPRYYFRSNISALWDAKIQNISWTRNFIWLCIKKCFFFATNWIISHCAKQVIDEILFSRNIYTSALYLKISCDDMSLSLWDSRKSILFVTFRTTL